MVFCLGSESSVDLDVETETLVLAGRLHFFLSIWHKELSESLALNLVHFIKSLNPLFRDTNTKQKTKQQSW